MKPGTENAPKNKTRSFGWWNNVFHLLLPQPVKYRFLSKEGRDVLHHNALILNETVFSGDGAARYEDTHLQNEASLRDIHSGPAITKRFLEKWCPPTGRMLEIGAGPGFWSSILLNRCDKAVFNDLSADMVAEHRKRRTPDELAKVEGYRVGPIEQVSEEMRARGERFDRIVSIGTLHHLARRHEQVPLVWELLSPGGEFVFIEPAHNLKMVLKRAHTIAFEYRAPYVPATHDFLTVSEVKGWVNSGLLPGARVVALGSTQFPALGRVAKDLRGYEAWDGFLQKFLPTRGMGSLVFGVLKKTK